MTLAVSRSSTAKYARIISGCDQIGRGRKAQGQRQQDRDPGADKGDEAENGHQHRPQRA